MRTPIIPVAVLLGFNGGFVDTAGFLGLQGLFTSHVTGNFVTLAASLVLGLTGAITKLLAIPVFITVVALARLIGNRLADSGRPPVPRLLIGQTLLLFVFFVLATVLGPFRTATPYRPSSPASSASWPCRSRTPCSGSISPASRRRPS